MTQRVTAHVTPEDTKAPRSHAVLWSYGVGYLARISGRCRETVNRAKRAGVEFGDPVEAVAWALARTHPLLADQVLEALGREPRYRVALGE